MTIMISSDTGDFIVLLAVFTLIAQKHLLMTYVTGRDLKGVSKPWEKNKGR